MGRCKVLLWAGCLMMAGLAQAGNTAKPFHVDTHLGVVSDTDGDYESAGSLDVGISYQLSGVHFRLGGLVFSELKLDNSDADVSVSVNGGYLELAKQFDLSVVQLEVGGGILASRVTAELAGREIGKENDTSPFGSIKVVRPLSRVIGVHAGWKYIEELSGKDFQIFEAGMRVSF